MSDFHILNNVDYPDKPLALVIADTVLLPARAALGYEDITFTKDEGEKERSQRVTNIFLRVLCGIVSLTVMLVPSLIALGIKCCLKNKQEESIQAINKVGTETISSETKKKKEETKSATTTHKSETTSKEKRKKEGTESKGKDKPFIGGESTEVKVKEEKKEDKKAKDEITTPSQKPPITIVVGIEGHLKCLKELEQALTAQDLARTLKAFEALDSIMQEKSNREKFEDSRPLTDKSELFKSEQNKVAEAIKAMSAMDSFATVVIGGDEKLAKEAYQGLDALCKEYIDGRIIALGGKRGDTPSKDDLVKVAKELKEKGIVVEKKPDVGSPREEKKEPLKGIAAHLAFYKQLDSALQAKDYHLIWDAFDDFDFLGINKEDEREELLTDFDDDKEGYCQELRKNMDLDAQLKKLTALKNLADAVKARSEDQVKIYFSSLDDSVKRSLIGQIKTFLFGNDECVVDISERDILVHPCGQNMQKLAEHLLTKGPILENFAPPTPSFTPKDRKDEKKEVKVEKFAQVDDYLKFYQAWLNVLHEKNLDTVWKVFDEFTPTLSYLASYKAHLQRRIDLMGAKDKESLIGAKDKEDFWAVFEKMAHIDETIESLLNLQTCANVVLNGSEEEIRTMFAEFREWGYVQGRMEALHGKKFSMSEINKYPPSDATKAVAREILEKGLVLPEFSVDDAPVPSTRAESKKGSQKEAQKEYFVSLKTYKDFGEKLKEALKAQDIDRVWRTYDDFAPSFPFALKFKKQMQDKMTSNVNDKAAYCKEFAQKADFERDDNAIAAFENFAKVILNGTKEEIKKMIDDDKDNIMLYIIDRMEALSGKKFSGNPFPSSPPMDELTAVAKEILEKGMWIIDPDKRTRPSGKEIDHSDEGDEKDRGPLVIKLDELISIWKQLANAKGPKEIKEGLQRVKQVDPQMSYIENDPDEQIISAAKENVEVLEVLADLADKALTGKSIVTILKNDKTDFLLRYLASRATALQGKTRDDFDDIYEDIKANPDQPIVKKIAEELKQKGFVSDYYGEKPTENVLERSRPHRSARDDKKALSRTPSIDISQGEAEHWLKFLDTDDPLFPPPAPSSKALSRDGKKSDASESQDEFPDLSRHFDFDPNRFALPTSVPVKPLSPKDDKKAGAPQPLDAVIDNLQQLRAALEKQDYDLIWKHFALVPDILDFGDKDDIEGILKVDFEKNKDKYCEKLSEKLSIEARLKMLNDLRSFAKAVLHGTKAEAIAAIKKISADDDDSDGEDDHALPYIVARFEKWAGREPNEKEMLRNPQSETMKKVARELLETGLIDARDEEEAEKIDEKFSTPMDTPMDAPLRQLTARQKVDEFLKRTFPDSGSLPEIRHVQTDLEYLLQLEQGTDVILVEIWKELHPDADPALKNEQIISKLQVDPIGELTGAKKELATV